MYAGVIVDVPAKQTDRPFDYAVPEKWRELIEIGSRVGVPFGSRVLQGFVVELRETTEMNADKIRGIREVLDLVPPLTPELVNLSEWMSSTYLCPAITALQAMIPGALKAKYERMISWNGEQDQTAIREIGGAELAQALDFIKARGQVKADELLNRFPDQARAVKQLVRQGMLSEVQTIKNRLNKKTVLTVGPAADPASLQQAILGLRPGAKRQKEVLAHFHANPGTVPMSELLAVLGVGASTVKALADKGYLVVKDEEIYRDPFAERNFRKTAPLHLTEEQSEVFHAVKSAMADAGTGVFLLHGVTGSGKTEVYLQLIRECLHRGREAVVLVPEIALTPQMVERFKGRFGDLVAVLHSRLSQGERYDEWRKIQLGKVRVAIGARSAVFAPFRNIGLFIIDEEHEASYKQEESPKYHAREVAIKRAGALGASVLLGSATPSLESYQASRAAASSYRLLSMKSRVEGRPLPGVSVVDMREELKAGNRSMFSRALYRAIEERMERQEQIILLLNRRGHSTFVMCRSCGMTMQCPDCDISLTYHQHSRTVRCHYCGYAEREPEVCPDCGSKHIRYFGTGTQKVEAELSKLFPDLRVIRMDVDTTGRKGVHEKLLGKFRSREADVLLGTQMVAKGLDFPHVTLVGVMAADTVLNLPDFRSAEKTFQLLTQVAGRAGRDKLPGEVVIQTYVPDHYSIQASAEHDFHGFAERELVLRKNREYPPFRRLILITLSHEELPQVIRAAEALAAKLKAYGRFSGTPNKAGGESYQIFGPVASPVPRVKNRFRFQVIVKFDARVPAIERVKEAMDEMQEWIARRQLAIGVDVDPQSMM